MAINRALYQEFMHLYINQAIKESDGTRLAEMQGRGLLVRHKEEKRRALKDARLAFDEHRHWPLEIILSHLNIERQDS